MDNEYLRDMQPVLEATVNGTSPVRSEFETALDNLCRAIQDQDFRKACDLKLQIERMHRNLESDLEAAYYEAMGEDL